MGGTEAVGRVVICDAGPLIHLDELACLDLVTDWGRVLVPGEVWEEVLHHRPSALSGEVAVFERATVPSEVPPRLRSVFQLFGLHAGERSALRLALDHEGRLVLSDDTAARMAASSIDVEVRGTLGVIVRSIRWGQRTKGQVLEILRTLPERSTLHLKPDLMRRVIREVETSNGDPRNSDS